MNKKITRIISASAAALLLLSSCGNDEKLLESSKEEKITVMTVGGFEVPMEIYRYVALNYKEQYEKGHSSDIWLGESGQALLTELNENLEKTLINMYTTQSLAVEYGIDLESAFIKDTLKSSMDIIYESYEFDYQVYTDYLRDYNMNDSVYRFFTLNDILADELVAMMLQNGDIPSDDAKLLEIIKGDEFIRVKQILVPSDNGFSDEENRAHAEKLLAQVENGADFDTLAQSSSEYGGDLYMFNNPDGYYMCRGSYHESFEDAAFALEIGEISGIVETDAGYSIIKRYEKEDGYISKNFNDLADSYVVSRYNQILEKHSETLTVSSTDKLADYPIFNLSMTAED